ncbi:MAG: prepilin-type N-terminal cleavage/methylation domain-containing protein [Bacillota bacterium]
MKLVKEAAPSHRYNNSLLNSAGFTLTELMIVVAIVAILVAVAVPAYETVKEDAAAQAHAANMRTITSAVHMYITDNGVPAGGGAPPGGWPAALAAYLQAWPAPPAGYAGSYTVKGSFPDYRVNLE